MINPFAEKYKTLSNAQLLDVTSNPGNYQSLAVEAAQSELAGRGLSVAELADAATELKAEADDAKVRAEQRERCNIRLKNGATAFAHSFRPWQPLSSRVGQLILLVCIVQGVIALKLLWEFVVEMSFTRHVGGWPMIVSDFTLFFALFVLGAIYLFLRGKKAGWILLSVFIVFFVLVSLTSVVFIVIRALRYSYIAGGILISSWLIISEILLCLTCAWIIYKKGLGSFMK